MADAGAADDEGDTKKEEEGEAAWTFVTSSKKGKSGKGKPRSSSSSSSTTSSSTATSASSHQLHTRGLRYVERLAMWLAGCNYACLDTYTPADMQRETTRLLVAVEAAKAALLPTAFYANLEHALLSRCVVDSGGKEGGKEGRVIRTLVCYGLGSIQSTNGHPLWQLACACLLKDRLNLLLSSSPSTPASCSSLTTPTTVTNTSSPSSSPSSSASSSSSPSSSYFPLLQAEAYDPLFDRLDTHLLTLLGWHVLPHNEHGKRPALTPTLFFMPCCHHRLYSNLLWANWSLTCLQNVLLIGNSLGSYEERALASEKGKDESDCVLPLLPWVRETRVSWKRREEEKEEEGKDTESSRRSEKEKEEKVVKSAFVDLCVTDFPNLAMVEGDGKKEKDKQNDKLESLFKRRPPAHFDVAENGGENRL